MNQTPVAELDLTALHPQRVRVSILFHDAQLDLSLPADIPIAGLIPPVVDLCGKLRTATPENAGSTKVDDAARDLLTLRRLDGGPTLDPEITLREAGIGDGGLLRLDAERALTPPTLHDDVVDAAARINRQGHSGWNAVAARAMAYVAVNLTTILLAYLTITPTFGSTPWTMPALATLVSLGLVAAATVASRIYGLLPAAMALGWATIPLLAAATWSAPTGFGQYVLAAKCAVMVAVLAALPSVIGTGAYVFVASGIAAAFAGAALAGHEAGAGQGVTGASMTVVGLLGYIGVRELARRRVLLGPSVAPEGEDAVSTAEPGDAHGAGDPTIDVYATMRSAERFRAGMYFGLAAGAAAGAHLVASSPDVAVEAGVAFAWCCAGVLGVCAKHVSSTVERVALGAPALTLWAWSATLADHGSTPFASSVFGAVVVAAVACPIVAVAHVRINRCTQLLAYASYLLSAALIPVTCWALRMFQHLGTG